MLDSETIISVFYYFSTFLLMSLKVNNISISVECNFLPKCWHIVTKDLTLVSVLYTSWNSAGVSNLHTGWNFCAMFSFHLWVEVSSLHVAWNLMLAFVSYISQNLMNISSFCTRTWIVIHSCLLITNSNHALLYVVSLCWLENLKQCFSQTTASSSGSAMLPTWHFFHRSAKPHYKSASNIFLGISYSSSRDYDKNKRCSSSFLWRKKYSIKFLNLPERGDYSESLLKKHYAVYIYLY